MNCVSLALFRARTGSSIAAADEAKITRVIEYFFPRGERTKIWVDIFVDNATNDELTLKILHAGRLTAENVTGDSWMTPDLTTSDIDSVQAEDGRNACCEVVLTKRILKLHQDYHPISVDQENGTISLDGKKYRACTNKLGAQMTGDGSGHIPFTLWEVGPFEPGTGTALRLRLDMSKETSRLRIKGKNSFFAYGEAIVLANIREDLQRCGAVGENGYDYEREFQNFVEGHKPPEAFEYLIVAKDKEVLGWNAEALSPLISDRFIESDDLANTTRWFATDSPYIDTWKLQANRKNAFILRVRQNGGEGTEHETLDIRRAEQPEFEPVG